LTHAELALHNVNALFVQAQSLNAQVRLQEAVAPAIGGVHACGAEVGEHTPCPAHVDQSDNLPVVLSQVRVCVPQLPHACVNAALLQVCPAQAPH
jgi:hypothetical protein